MGTLNNRSKSIILGLIILLFTAACTSQSEPDLPAVGDQPATGDQPTPVDDEPISDAPEDQQLDDETSDAEAIDTSTSGESESGQVATSALTWTTEVVGEGIKPALAIDADGNAHLAFLTESDHGTVFYATNVGGSFDIDTVSEGYFYGPVDIALNDDGVPHIAYHDHQETDFNPRKGDEVVAILNEGAWQLFTVANGGHDGWDNSIVVDADGNWHTAAVDPAQFGSSDGVEYATNQGGTINVTSVSDGPVVYEFGTSIALDEAGQPAISYYDDTAQQLVYVALSESGWSVQIVDDAGDAGRYSSLVFDKEGNPQISYYVATSATAGVVRHARWDGSSWQIEDVDNLDDVQMGHTGARKITSLAIGPDGAPHIAYTDRGRVTYGIKSDSGWSLQDVEINSDSSLGQLVELALDHDGNPYLTWFEVTQPAPLNGQIIFASRR
jgi:hypothetical protein